MKTAALMPISLSIAKTPRATGNDYIHTFISFVCEQIRQTIYLARRTNPLHDLIEVNVGEHIRVYEALAEGDAVKSAHAMRAHIVGAAQRVGVNLPEAGSAGMRTAAITRKAKG